MNQLDYENHGDFGSTDIMQHQLFRNFNFFTKLQREYNHKIYFVLDTRCFTYSRLQDL